MDRPGENIKSSLDKGDNKEGETVFHHRDGRSFKNQEVKDMGKSDY